MGARRLGGNFNKRQIGCKSGERKRESRNIQRTKQEEFKDFLIVLSKKKNQGWLLGFKLEWHNEV